MNFIIIGIGAGLLIGYTWLMVNLLMVKNRVCDMRIKDPYPLQAAYQVRTVKEAAKLMRANKNYFSKN